MCSLIEEKCTVLKLFTFKLFLHYKLAVWFLFIMLKRFDTLSYFITICIWLLLMTNFCNLSSYVLPCQRCCQDSMKNLIPRKFMGSDFDKRRNWTHGVCHCRPRCDDYSTCATYFLWYLNVFILYLRKTVFIKNGNFKEMYTTEIVTVYVRKENCD